MERSAGNGDARHSVSPPSARRDEGERNNQPVQNGPYSEGQAVMTAAAANSHYHPPQSSAPYPPSSSHVHPQRPLSMHCIGVGQSSPTTLAKDQNQGSQSSTPRADDALTIPPVNSALRASIDNGQPPPRERLPSMRQLTESLATSVDVRPSQLPPQYNTAPRRSLDANTDTRPPFAFDPRLESTAASTSSAPPPPRSFDYLQDVRPSYPGHRDTRHQDAHRDTRPYEGHHASRPYDGHHDPRPSATPQDPPPPYYDVNQDSRPYIRDTRLDHPAPHSTSAPPPSSFRPAVLMPPSSAFEGHLPAAQSFPGRDADLRLVLEVGPGQRSQLEGYSRYSLQHGAAVPPPGAYPPGQQPLPPVPPPRQTGPSHSPPYQHGRRPSHPEDDYMRKSYEVSPSRQLSEYHTTLNRLGSSARTIYNFSEAFESAAGASDARLPTDMELDTMMDNANAIHQSLHQLRSMVHNDRMRHERVREVFMETTRRRSRGEVEEVTGYGGPPQAHRPPYHGHPSHHPLHPNGYPHPSGSESKKRRGRAAPPGRCHSCNRVDTPEWRRGPDGARTLCNACGLHFAKLERKRLMEARSLQPKPRHDGEQIHR